MSMFYELMMKKKGMPERYQEVEYIESDGTQYIDTGYIAETNTIFEVDCAFTDLSAGRNGYLQNTGGNVYRYYFGVLNSKFVGANNTTYNHSIQDADTQRHIFAIKQDGIYIDNTKVYSSNALYGSINIYLFVTNVPDAADGKNYYCKQKVYNSKIYENNRLVRNFIPVYDTLTNKYGMWETVQGKFYGNDGTGDFKGSIVGYTIVGSPTITDGVVTDFSASNYLQLPTINTLPNNVEFGVAFTTNTVKGVRLLGTSGAASIMSSLSISGTSKITFQLANSSKSFSVISSVSYITGQKYYVEGYQKGTILGIKVSTDNINWVTTEIEIDEGFTTTLPSVLYLGINKNSNSYLEGSLDLNYTYIKLDNKLWFNGQQS